MNILYARLAMTFVSERSKAPPMIPPTMGTAFPKLTTPFCTELCQQAKADFLINFGKYRPRQLFDGCHGDLAAYLYSDIFQDLVNG